jgi:hypothetical protein
MDVSDVVTHELRKRGASKETIDLWGRLSATYEKEGKDAVKRLIEDQVEASGKRVKKEAKSMSDVVKAATRMKPKRKR